MTFWTSSSELDCTCVCDESDSDDSEALGPASSVSEFAESEVVVGPESSDAVAPLEWTEPVGAIRITPPDN